MKHTLDYSDLVTGTDGEGTRFRIGGSDPRYGLDCKGLALNVLRRLGRDVPDHALIGASVRRGAEAKAAFDRYLSEQGKAWQKVSEATELGDILVQRWRDELHISVLVDTRRMLALHATQAHGVHAVPIASMRGVQCVLRLRETGS